MRIHIEGDLYISGDRLEYAIERKTTTQSGKTAGAELFTQISHHPTVQSCLKAIMRMKIADSTATTLQELKADVERIEREISEVIHF